MSDKVTLAADLVTGLQVGDSKLQLPGIVTYDSPFRRTVNPTNIPEMRDDVVDGSFGFKLTPARKTIITVTVTITTFAELSRDQLVEFADL